MRKIIPLLIILTSGLVVEAKANQPFGTNSTLELTVTSANITANNQRIIVDPDFQEMVDSLAKGTVTNGLACGIAFTHTSKKGMPVFYIYVINTTTNFIRSCLNLPFEALAHISLIDASGKPVAKTAAGERVGTWTEKQVEGLFYAGGHPMVKRGSKVSTFFPLWPTQVSGEISISQLFQLKQAGEYTLHLQMQVVQVKEDKSGKISFQTTWLPKVVAKVQVRPEDIVSTNSIPNRQTNSLVK